MITHISQNGNRTRLEDREDGWLVEAVSYKMILSQRKHKFEIGKAEPEIRVVCPSYPPRRHAMWMILGVITGLTLTSLGTSPTLELVALLLFLALGTIAFDKILSTPEILVEIRINNRKHVFSVPREGFNDWLARHNLIEEITEQNDEDAGRLDDDDVERVNLIINGIATSCCAIVTMIMAPQISIVIDPGKSFSEKAAVAITIGYGFILMSLGIIRIGLTAYRAKNRNLHFEPKNQPQ